MQSLKKKTKIVKILSRLKKKKKKKNESIPKRMSSPSWSTGIKPKGCMCNTRKVSGWGVGYKRRKKLKGLRSWREKEAVYALQ